MSISDKNAGSPIVILGALMVIVAVASRNKNKSDHSQKGDIRYNIADIFLWLGIVVVVIGIAALIIDHLFVPT